MTVLEIKGTLATIDKANEIGGKYGIHFADDNHIYLERRMVGMYKIIEGKKRINITILEKDAKLIELIYKLDPAVSSQV
jgi:hypothetical protein